MKEVIVPYPNGRQEKIALSVAGAGTSLDTGPRASEVKSIAPVPTCICHLPAGPPIGVHFFCLIPVTSENNYDEIGQALGSSSPADCQVELGHWRSDRSGRRQVENRNCLTRN